MSFMAGHDSRSLTRRALLGTGAAVALTAAGTYALRGSGHASAHITADGKTLNRANGAEPDSLDPHKASGHWEFNIIGDMFLGLMTLNAAGNPILGAAESYAASADGKTYTFTLRDHIWSDGVPVTAHDFVYSFRRLFNPKTAAQYASVMYPIKNAEAVNGGRLPPDQLGVRAIDDKTLEIAFHFEVPYIAELMTHMTAFPVPRHVVERHDDAWIMPQNVVTSGPYLLKEWVPNDHILLVKNPSFAKASTVKIENVYYYPTPDSSAALKRFRAGEFDMITEDIPSQQIDWLRANLPRELKLMSYIGTKYVQFNLARKPFDDIRVRKAISMAMNREVIVSKVTRENEEPGYALVPSCMPGYPGKAQPDFRSMRMVDRIVEAKRLIAEAGYGPQNPLTFDYNVPATSQAKLVSVVLQEMWRQVGAQVRLVQLEPQVHYQLLRKRDFQCGWCGWAADYRDAKNFLFLFQTSSTDMNFSNYSSKAFDSLMDKSDQEGNGAKRQLLLQAAEQVLLNDAPLASVFFATTPDLVSPQVKGWVANNVNFNRTQFLSLDRSIPNV